MVAVFHACTVNAMQILAIPFIFCSFVANVNIIHTENAALFPQSKPISQSIFHYNLPQHLSNYNLQV